MSWITELPRPTKSWPTTMRLNLYMRQTVGTARHVSGTCRMGPDSDNMTVVDQYCRVKGMQGLWVADASIVPQLLGGGGMHTTVIMIGERVVDWIGGGLTQRSIQHVIPAQAGMMGFGRLEMLPTCHVSFEDSP